MVKVKPSSIELDIRIKFELGLE